MFLIRTAAGNNRQPLAVAVHGDYWRLALALALALAAPLRWKRVITNVFLGDVDGLTEAADSGGILVILVVYEGILPPFGPPPPPEPGCGSAEHHLDRLLRNFDAVHHLETISFSFKADFSPQSPDLHPLRPGSGEQRSFLDGSLMVSGDQSPEINRLRCCLIRAKTLSSPRRPSETGSKEVIGPGPVRTGSLILDWITGPG